MKIKFTKRHDIFGGETKIKNKFKYRKNGTKTISSSGTIYQLTGTTCNPVNIASVMPTVSQSGKKKLKQKHVGSIYFVDLNNPYSVTFTHSNGFNHTLTFTEPCSH